MMGSSLVLAAAFAAGVNCQSLTDMDVRAQCYAQSRNDVSACDSIMDPDHRAMCRAVVTKRPYNCDVIQGSNKRAMCGAGV